MKIKANIQLISATVLLFTLFSCKTHKELKKTDTTDVKKTESKVSEIQKKYAAILGVEPKAVKNEKLYSFIDDWYGVPYQYGGKSKSGVDCSGFCVILYDQIYQKKIAPSAKALAEETKKIKTSDLEEGDLVFFNIDHGKISHVGVYLQNNKFVHASTKKGIMINDLNEPYYQKYFVQSGRVK